MEQLAPPPSARRVPSGTHGYTVLVVDDERDIAEAARDVLEHMVPGCHVITAESKAAGLEHIRREPVDAVLVDYRMPNGNGLDFIRAVHELEPDVPAILMTAYGSVEVATEAVNRCHVDGFLAKPIDARQLAHAVEGALHRHSGTAATDGTPLRW